jgi:FkbM family methyltransferase
VPLLIEVKNFCIHAGLYRPARWLSRRLRPAQLQAHNDDIRFYRSLLPPSALCFDVGANIGEKSEAMLKAGGRVVALEPSPVALLELRARCSQERDWTLVAAAVGGEPGIAVLHAPQDSGKSSLAQDWHSAVVKTYYVPVVTLDAAIKTFGKPFYCKIDVEGWELEVLKGLSQPIPLISFEFHLNEKNITKAVLCLKRLSAFGPSYVNVAPAESSFFYFKEWILLDDFIEWFPGDLKHELPGDSYADVFVKNATQV